MARPHDLQQALVENILGQFAKKAEAASALMEILSINRDGIYRRLRGEKLLTAEEVGKIAVHFKISLDDLLFDSSEKGFFTFGWRNRKIKSFWDYLVQVNEQAVRLSKEPNLKVYYTTREIPFFLFMMFPRLLSFKMYLYGLTTWQLDYLHQEKFHFDLVLPQEIELARETSRLYCSVDTIEMWTSAIVDQSLNQIEYAAMSNHFRDKETGMAVARETMELVEHCRLMAETGLKFLPGHSPQSGVGKFDLYNNELASTGNTILAISDRMKVLYNVFDSPNYLYTTDNFLCTAMADWFDKVLVHSVSISFHAEKNRSFYFNRLRDKVDQTLQRLELTLE